MLDDLLKPPRMRANWTLGLAILAALLIVPFGPLASSTLPPVSYILIAIYAALQIVVLALGIAGLRRFGLYRGRTIAGLVLIGLTFLIFEPFAVSGILDNAIKQRLAEIETALDSACQGQGNPRAAEYVPGPARHPMIASLPVGMHPVSYLWIDEQFWPESLGQTQLVLCVGEQYSIRMDTCEYSDGSLKDRHWRARDARLVEARSGEVVAEGTVRGSEPDECPEGIVQGDEAYIYGGTVNPSDVLQWVMQVLNP